jgi:hypothetical protein
MGRRDRAWPHHLGSLTPLSLADAQLAYRTQFSRSGQVVHSLFAEIFLEFHFGSFGE